jgi:hypothetical protein
MILLNYTAVTTDPEENQIYYNFSWGEGNYSGWLGPVNSSENITASYTYLENDSYQIQVKAKDDQGLESSWSEPFNVTIAPQMELENLKRGFLYIRNNGILNDSYAYLYILDTLGFTMLLGAPHVDVEANASAAVDSVKFKILNLFWGDNLTDIDEDGSDGFSTRFLVPVGLYQLTAFAYDDQGNLIDDDQIEYLIYFVRGSEESGFATRFSVLRERLREFFMIRFGR